MKVPRRRSTTVRLPELQIALMRERGFRGSGVVGSNKVAAGNTMFNPFNRQRGDVTIETLYGAIVAQARDPSFYADYGVPDTVEGRFDMIVLHLALLVRRLRREDEQMRRMGQAVFDRFCADMDHNLREMGLSDMAVPRRMRRFGEAFYGRAAAYDRGLDAGETGELRTALGRNVFGQPEEAAESDVADGGAARLAAYMREAERRLDAQPAATLARGELSFPDPAAIMALPGA